MARDISRPVGVVTRGTTSSNRLRRCDRWLAGPQAWRLRRANDPLVVDLGYGATPITVLELATRLCRIRPDVEVVGIEIDPARVEAARAFVRPGLTFVHGGFELAIPQRAGDLAHRRRRPVVVRAFNVLRQYPVADVEAAWSTMLARLAPDGVLVDGTCDEVGRRAAWVMLTAEQGPVSLTVSMRLAGLDRPSSVAERLPKVLIHRNVPGEGVHAWLAALDQAWARAAPQAAFGVRQRWLATVAGVREAGWPVLGGPSRWRLGEVGVTWAAVRPGP